MNRFLPTILLIALLGAGSAFAQQSPDEASGKLLGYMSASASSGELKSATMTCTRDGGTFEKLENDDSVLKLSRGDFIEFGFTLPATAYNVDVTIKYLDENEGNPCFIRWNNVNPPEEKAVVKPPKKIENLCYKTYTIIEPPRFNTIRVVGEGNNGLKFYNIQVKFNYDKPASQPTKDNFKITLDSPDPTKSIDNVDLTFKWTGTGKPPVDGGFIELQYRDKDDWKTVPGAEYIDIEPEGSANGEFVWKKHGLTEMPDFKVIFTAGPSPIKNSNAAFDKGVYNESLYWIQQALQSFPDKKEYKDRRIECLRALNPFNTECRKMGDVISVEIDGVEFKFVYIANDKDDFFMGPLSNDNKKNSDAFRHPVKLSRGYWILNQEVSRKQWDIIMSSNPSFLFSKETNPEKLPVQNVSWEDCNEFCKQFYDRFRDYYKDDKIKLTTTVSLPTEAQWEFACRKGGPLSSKAIHYNTNKLLGAPPTIGVTDKSANSLGVFGMQGNVAEWCYDGYAPYQKTTQNDPKGNEKTSLKVVRGGSCNSSQDDCRATARDKKNKDEKDKYIGFRFVVNFDNIQQ